MLQPLHIDCPNVRNLLAPPDLQGARRAGGETDCRLAAAEDVPVALDASRFVVRHSAVVGSTGSGKTSAVASILQNFIKGGWNAANIIVVDPHGEYSAAIGSSASVRSVLAQEEVKRLRVPYWALPALDILRIFAGGTGGATFSNRFAELVTKARRDFVASADWLTNDPTTVTADTPIPFDIRPIWHQLDRENRETRSTAADPATARETVPGDAAALRSAQFEPYGPGGTPPHKGPMHGVYGTSPDLLRLGLLDPRLRFFQEPQGTSAGPDPLVGVMQEWLGGDKPVSVLDFNGVPTGAADAAIGVVLNLLLEVAFRCEVGGEGIGRPSPVLLVLEEAHRYLGEGAGALTRSSANRIAREGRKYGVGVLLVTQRPTELPKTALAQCGTIVALRLSNSEDQGAIKTALPDAIAGLAAILPSLRTHEAIISGESLILPARTVLDTPDPWPSAEDPSLKPWREDSGVPNVSPALKAWRETYE